MIKVKASSFCSRGLKNNCSVVGVNHCTGETKMNLYYSVQGGKSMEKAINMPHYLSIRVEAMLWHGHVCLPEEPGH